MIVVQKVLQTTFKKKNLYMVKIIQSIKSGCGEGEKGRNIRKVSATEIFLHSMESVYTKIKLVAN